MTTLLQMTQSEKHEEYLAQLKKPFTKITRLRFLNPDGSTAFALDNNYLRKRNKCFIADGSITCNLQNGQRRTADIMLANLNDEFNYNVNNIWFGQEIAIDEGLLLNNGQEYYIQQGIFLVDTPIEERSPQQKTMTYNLTDKWANLDGTLFGNLESTYQVPYGTNIFAPIKALLLEDRGNGLPLDRITPIFTEYYNNKTQLLPTGEIAEMTNSPYTLIVDSDTGTKADVILELANMVNALVGYDNSGALRIDPSQDDIIDKTKPIAYQFSQNEAELLGMTYTVKNTEVYNDFIVVGEQMSDYSQPKGRATNTNPASDTNINLIGRKTLRYYAAGYATDKQCQDLAEWKLKRSTVLQKAVDISCSQIFHINENNLITIVRTDKQDNPVERHLIQGFTRPLAGNGNMTISCVSVNDLL